MIELKRSEEHLDQLIECSSQYLVDSDLEELIQQFDEADSEDPRNIDGRLKAYSIKFLHYCTSRLVYKSSL